MKRDNSKPLHIKYRPANFDEVIGNEGTVESLQDILAREEGIVKAFLLTGPSGCGKTTIARLIGKSIGCATRDFHEYNASNTRGIDTIRNIERTASLSSKAGRVYLLDECHQITGAAQEALLKMVEDPPKNAYFILATTDPQKLKKTLKGRCTKYEVKLLNKKLLSELVLFVADSEGIDYPKDLALAIGKKAEGSPREALVLLDKVIDNEDDKKAMQIIEEHSLGGESQEIKSLCQALLKRDKWKNISKILKGIKEEPESVKYAVFGYFNAVLENSGNETASIIISEFSDPYIFQHRAHLTNACFNSLK